MEIIHKTLVTNKLNSGRTYRFFGKRGLYLGPKESKIVDGLYPSACRNPGSIQDLEACIKAGHIEIELITNLPVRRPTGGKGAVDIPEAVKKQPVVVDREVSLREQEGIELNTVEGGLHDVSEESDNGIVKVKTKPLEEATDGSPDARFQQKTLEQKRYEDTITLPGHEGDTDIPQPQAKEIFGDPGEKIDPMAYSDEAKRARDAQTLAEAEKADAESRGDTQAADAAAEAIAAAEAKAQAEIAEAKAAAAAEVEAAREEAAAEIAAARDADANKPAPKKNAKKTAAKKTAPKSNRRRRGGSKDSGTKSS